MEVLKSEVAQMRKRATFQNHQKLKTEFAEIRLNYQQAVEPVTPHGNPRWSEDINIQSNADSLWTQVPKVIGVCCGC